MTKKEFQLLLKVLEKIKNPDTYVSECKHNVERELDRFERMKGQLRDMGEYDYTPY